MARQKSVQAERAIESYRHADKERLNNPPVGLVTPETDPDAGRQTYAYDPHLDPQLQWAGKAEHTSFEVPTISLTWASRCCTSTAAWYTSTARIFSSGWPAGRCWCWRPRGRIASRIASSGNSWMNG